jgi:hypothetical protein
VGEKFFGGTPPKPLDRMTQVPERENFSPISPENHLPELTQVWRKAASDHLPSRLQAGSNWLTVQHQAWLEGEGVSDERFSAALAAWDSLERTLRQVYGYDGCIFGPDRRCPDDTPTTCDCCRAGYGPNPGGDRISLP